MNFRKFLKNDVCYVNFGLKAYKFCFLLEISLKIKIKKYISKKPFFTNIKKMNKTSAYILPMPNKVVFPYQTIKIRLTESCEYNRKILAITF